MPDYQNLAMKILSGKLRNKNKGNTFSMQRSSSCKTSLSEALNANREINKHYLHLNKFIEKGLKGLLKHWCK